MVGGWLPPWGGNFGRARRRSTVLIQEVAFWFVKEFYFCEQRINFQGLGLRISFSWVWSFRVAILFCFPFWKSRTFSKVFPKNKETGGVGFCHFLMACRRVQTLRQRRQCQRWVKFTGFWRYIGGVATRRWVIWVMFFFGWGGGSSKIWWFFGYFSWLPNKNSCPLFRWDISWCFNPLQTTGEWRFITFL